jgi:hypothetical protein
MMRYPEFLAQGLPIATGVIEGACRHLVQGRLGITGARWQLDGAEAVLELRAVHSSGDWVSPPVSVGPLRAAITADPVTRASTGAPETGAPGGQHRSARRTVTLRVPACRADASLIARCERPPRRRADELGDAGLGARSGLAFAQDLLVR